VRRRYIDITLSQLRPSYFFDLQQYNRVLYQRNMLLKEIGAGRTSSSTLDVWTHHLIKIGSKIIKRRQDFLYELGKKARERHQKLTNCAEDLKLSYQPSFEIHEESQLKDIEEIFQRELKKAEKRELQKCSTQLGPQRDDFDIHLNGLNTKQFGSQGQQRTSVLSLKLAEIDIIFEEKQDYPILLLDDVLSELDENRQEYLYENIGEVQTLITGTDVKKFANRNKNTSFFRIVAGQCLQNNNK
jgi:DNA replication and repair protein RecF